MPHNDEKLIEALNLKNVPEAERDEILKKVNERLNSVLISVLISNIFEEEAARIHKAMEGEGDLEEIVAEISARIPGLADKIERGITEEIMRLREVLKQSS